ncbi:MAG: hypothetical protein M1820_001735 [Bogoriella megaspora]|nr:MAG: hypothetical protein M1820_001735 [Bogoriella megaspora]
MFLFVTLFSVFLRAAASNTNVTNTTISTASSSTPAASNSSGQLCCSVFIDFVALNVWYSSSLEYTKATVITEYAQYNNTIVPSTTITVLNNATTTQYPFVTRVDVAGEQMSFSNIPNLIGYDGGFYDGTALDSTTIWHDNHTAIPSPTPFAVIGEMFVVAGTMSGTECIGTYSIPATTQTYTATTETESAYSYSDGHGSWTTISASTITHPASTVTDSARTNDVNTLPIESLEMSFGFNGREFDSDWATMIDLEPPYYWLPGLDYNSNWTNGGTERYLKPMPEFMEFIESQPEVLAKFPSIAQCQAGLGEGAPTLHIPVAELTVQSARTIPVGGNYGGAGGGTAGSGGVDNGKTTVAGTASPTTQPAQAPSTTPVIAPSTATAAPRPTNLNPESTIPMGYTSIHPASSPGTQLPSPVVPVPEPQSTAGSGELESHNPSQPHSQGTDADLGSGQSHQQEPSESPIPVVSQSQGFNEGQPQGGDGEQQGPLSPTIASNAAAGDNIVSVIHSGGNRGGNYNNGGNPQASNSATVVVSASSPTTDGSNDNSGQPSGESGSDEADGEESSSGDSEPGYNEGSSNYGALPAGTKPFLVGSVTANPVVSGAYALPGGPTITAGGAPVVTAGTTFSLGPSGAVVVNGQTVSTLASNQLYAAPVQLGAVIAIPVGPHAIVMGTQTLSAGGPQISISGTLYSLGSSGAVVVNGETLSTVPVGPYAALVTLGDATATQLESGTFAIGSQTVRIGGAPVTVSGTTYSLSPSGAVVVNGEMHSSLSADDQSSGITAVTIASQVIAASAIAGSALIMNGETLIPGGSAVTITANGRIETVSLPAYALSSSQAEIVVDGKTETLPLNAASTTEIDGAALTLAPTSVSELVVGGQTLVAGGSALVTNGVTVSEASNGDILEMSSGVTRTVGSVGSGGVGSYIMSGFGGTGRPAATSAPAAFEGGGGKTSGKWFPGIVAVLSVIFTVAGLAR